MEQALARVPRLADAGVKEPINGPEAFTPDGSFILLVNRRSVSSRGSLLERALNAYGIAAAGGAGRALAEWIVAGEPTMTLACRYSPLSSPSRRSRPGAPAHA